MSTHNLSHRRRSGGHRARRVHLDPSELTGRALVRFGYDLADPDPAPAGYAVAFLAYAELDALPAPLTYAVALPVRDARTLHRSPEPVVSRFIAEMSDRVEALALEGVDR